MRAYWGENSALALSIAENRTLLAVDLENSSGIPFEFLQGRGRLQPVFDEIGHEILILTDVLQCCFDGFAAWGEQVAPRIRFFGNKIPNQGCGEGPQRDAISRKAGGHELVLSHFADIGQAIRGFKNLSRSAVVWLRGGKDLLQSSCQAFVTILGLLLLPGLVILATDDH